jgi:hypothetical protein
MKDVNNLFHAAYNKNKTMMSFGELLPISGEF